MTAALLIAALMFGAGVCVWGAINIFLVIFTPDLDMVDEVAEEAQALDVWRRL